MEVSSTSVLEQPVEALRGVAVKRGAVLREAGIRTVGDLFYCLPRRYLDRSSILPIADITPGMELTLIGQVGQVDYVPKSGGRLIVRLEDESGGIDLIWFRGGRFLRSTFKAGDQVAVSGKVDSYRNAMQLVHPEYEFVAVEEEARLLHTGSIVPLYAGNADLKERGIRSRSFRRLVSDALDAFVDLVEDPLPDSTRARLGFPVLKQCLRQVHFPRTLEQVERARRRLAFDELFQLQQTLIRARRKRISEANGISFPASTRLVIGLHRELEFSLTPAQDRAIEEIFADMSLPVIMARLLQGDVGSGKTLVAVFALVNAVESGYQGAMMVPTEVLAEQHFVNLQRMVGPLGVNVALLTGALSAPARSQILHGLRTGEIDTVVGTHALIQQGVGFARLGLVVVDEQHRFGVVQRSMLFEKGERPDVLTMTATPIPRTLALTRFGGQDISTLDELPAGRRPVRTAVRHPGRRQRVLEFAADQIRTGYQVYYVFPLIEESESTDMISALAGYEELVKQFSGTFAVELLHGRMKADEKQEVMNRFKAGEVHMLATTTVIEVGVDVANATVMIIEHAERFGLAQLHQLRGRVGRGGNQSYCILFSSAIDEAPDSIAAQRLQVLCQTEDGFDIAQRDLELRGPGELLGIRQAGLPELVVADLMRQDGLVELARREAELALDHSEEAVTESAGARMDTNEVEVE